ncbi:hypothetical protein [Microcoleus sp. herbarium2]|uniref:hypothetical protein n=1 Tax=Microcoleus sp. herbarium2 TaxID=3055433 RepID=UPI004040BC78
MAAVDEAIRTAQFVRNSCIRLWMDTKGIGKNDLKKYCAVLARDFPFAGEVFQFYKFRTSDERSRCQWQSSPRRTANHCDR